MTKLTKLTKQEWSKILVYINTNFLYSDNNVLLPFSKVVMPILLLLDQDIQKSEKKIPDLYIDTEGKNLVIKGTIPSHYKTTQIAKSIVYTLFKYFNRQYQRGLDKNPVLWIKSVYILNSDLYKIEHEQEEKMFMSKEHSIINKYKKNDKTYSYSEEINYNILKKHSDTMSNIFDIINKINGISSELKQIMINELNEQGFISNETLKELDDDVKKEIENKLPTENNIPINWYKHGKDDKEKVEKVVNLIQRSVRNNLSKLRGIGAGSLIQELKKILGIEIDWTEILSKALNTMIEKSESKKWSYPNIYYKHIAYLPSDDVEEKINNITCFIDTSGSMSNNELKKIFGIIFDLIEKNDIRSVTIVQHDYNLQTHDLIQTEDINNAEDFLKYTKIKGRGGTSHVKPFEEFNKLIDNDVLPVPDLIIFMSDFESDFEELIPTLNQEFYDYFCITTYRKVPVPKDHILKIGNKSTTL